MRKQICLFFTLLLCLGMVVTAQAEGILFLTVSQMTLPVVGDQENIYAGTLPLESVTWESSDSSIISVSEGVVEAKKVGSATITAKSGDQTVSCTVECLAVSEDDLLTLPPRTLLSPRRVPPKVTIDPKTFFADAVMVGDSVTANLMVHETATNLLGHPIFLARKNIGVFNLVNHVMNLYYKGEELHAEDAVAATKAKKVFFLLGMNDLGYQSPQSCAKLYGELIDRVQAKNPGIEIYIQTCLPNYCYPRLFSDFNASIDTFNTLVAEIAQKKGCHVIDLAAYIEDQVNSLSSGYTSDMEAHLNYEGSVIWMDVLRAYAYTHTGA